MGGILEGDCKDPSSRLAGRYDDATSATGAAAADGSDVQAVATNNDHQDNDDDETISLETTVIGVHVNEGGV